MQQGWKIDSSSSNFLVPPSRSVIIITITGKSSTATAGDNVIWLGYGGYIVCTHLNSSPRATPSHYHPLRFDLLPPFAETTVALDAAFSESRQARKRVWANGLVFPTGWYSTYAGHPRHRTNAEAFQMPRLVPPSADLQLGVFPITWMLLHLNTLTGQANPTISYLRTY